MIILDTHSHHPFSYKMSPLPLVLSITKKKTMSLQSYEAIYDHGQMEWLGDKPQVEEARVIVTILAGLKRHCNISKAPAFNANCGKRKNYWRHYFPGGTDRRLELREMIVLDHQGRLT